MPVSVSVSGDTASGTVSVRSKFPHPNTPYTLLGVLVYTLSDVLCFAQFQHVVFVHI